MISAFTKQSAASITLIASIAYFIRWLIRQHQQQIDSEAEIWRYRVDFERASWAVETALEWKREQATPIPDALLAAICRELFKWQRGSDEADHTPADMLASALLGSASKVNLNTGIAQIEIDSRKLQKAELPKSA